MEKEVVNIRIKKELIKGELKWYSYHAGETFEAYRTPFEDFFCYHLTEKGNEKLGYLRAEKDIEGGKGRSAIVYSDCCDEVIYLIYAFPQDLWEPKNLLGYALTEQEAKADCEKRTKRYEIYKEVKEKTTALADAIKMEKNEARIEIPRWKAGIAQKDITDEMRAEREGIEEKNTAISERNSIKYCDWTDKRNKVREDYIDSLDHDKDTTKFLKKNIVGAYMSGLYLSGYGYEVVKRI